MNYIELSREISYALRHAPWEYELEMDEYGWVDVNQLIAQIKIAIDDFVFFILIEYDKINNGVILFNY